MFEHVQTLFGSSVKNRLTAFSMFLILYTIVHNTKFTNSDRFYREGERSSFCDSYMSSLDVAFNLACYVLRPLEDSKDLNISQSFQPDKPGIMAS